MPGKGLAALTVGLTVAGVLCAEIAVVRGAGLAGAPARGWLIAVGTLAVLGLALGQARRLARQLHRAGFPRWRLTPAGAAVLLPDALGALLLLLGPAASSYWPDWVGAAVGAAFLRWLSAYALERWADRAQA